MLSHCVEFELELDLTLASNTATRDIQTRNVTVTCLP